MNRKLERNDQLYNDIEEFKDYELTQCIVFEMAIRSKYFKDKIQKQIEKNKKEASQDMKNSIDEQISDDKEHFQLSLFDELGIDEESYKSIQDHPLFLDLLENEKWPLPIKSKNGEFCAEHDGILCEDESGNLYLSEEIDREGYKINNEAKVFADMVYEHFDDGSYVVGGVIDNVEQLRKRLNENNNIDFVLTNNLITPKFSRPALNIHHIYKRKAILELNLSLPVHENIKYLEHIMADLKKNPDLVKSPIELFGDRLTSASVLKYLDIKSSSKQLKLATMFYIYDAFEQGLKQSAIKREMSYHNSADMDERIIKDMHELAQQYIDNELYKELLTGVKNDY